MAQTLSGSPGFSRTIESQLMMLMAGQRTAASTIHGTPCTGPTQVVRHERLCNIYLHAEALCLGNVSISAATDPQTAEAQTWLGADAIKVGVSVPEDSMNPEEPQMDLIVFLQVASQAVF